ncbi:MAG TPA: hypothetical protein ENH10_08045 [Bacteroidetes bacterium]|nr:hypothetical protein [Bacteroidota bacterium]HEX05088.1 hypothetical protein [Bacteroidota bacterium]
MEITPVSAVLVDVGFNPPNLNVLVPSVDNYKALLLQPHGNIDASGDGVRNRDRELAYKQYEKFLEDACQVGADLVVTPEYSMPWKSLSNALKAGVVPAQGKLWAFGCESIKYSELEALRDELSDFVRVIFEPLDSDNERFLSPLAYVFNAPSTDGNGEERTVVLVQFKTHPMGDPNHFEVNAMQRGTQIYQFGGGEERLKLVSLICADVFAFEDAHARAIYDRALILHIQLNPEPRHVRFLGSRERLLGFNGDATEILCLNWAREIHSWNDGTEKLWHNIAGSVWYLKSKEYDDKDTTLCDNHRRGLYYTWLQPYRTHALFFNFEPASYLLEMTKVAHIGVPGAASRRRGPQLVKTNVWDNTTTEWKEQSVVDDGFSHIAGESGNAKDDVERIANANPFAAERVLALCAGKIGVGDTWHTVRKLDSFVIDASEVIRRITFCQDTDESACEFRVARLKRCGYLWDILTAGVCLPPALADFKDGFSLEWIDNSPHQNAISTNGQRATVIYMGEESNDSQVEATAKRAAEYLHRGFADQNESRSAMQRIAIWYRKGNEIALYDHHRLVQIDQTGEASQFDIGREQ